MEIIQLLSFHQIVKTGSFTKASKNVFRTQSAISHQIKNLEVELKVKLFERKNKTIKLTWEGEILFDTICRFLDDIENLNAMYEDARQGKRGSLVIATSSALVTYCLIDTIKKFMKQATKVKFKLITSTNISEIQSMVLDGDAHLGIAGKSGAMPSQKLNFLYWRSFDKVLLVNKEHPLSKKKTVPLVDIAQYPLILYREGSALRKDVEEAFIRRNLSYEIIIESDVAENIKKYVETGIGISILSSLTLTKEDKMKFVFFNVNNLFKKTHYGIYYGRNKYITTSMKEFIKCFAPELYSDLKSNKTV